MTVLLTHTDSPPTAITPGRSYVVLGIEADWYRLLNDQGEPCLYDPSILNAADPTEPADWVSFTGDEGERYAYPEPLAGVGFFEDFFDDVPEAVRAFWSVVNHRLAAAA